MCKPSHELQRVKETSEENCQPTMAVPSNKLSEDLQPTVAFFLAASRRRFSCPLSIAHTNSCADLWRSKLCCREKSTALATKCSTMKSNGRISQGKAFLVNPGRARMSGKNFTCLTTHILINITFGSEQE